MKTIIEPSRNTPVIKDVDVIVAGGGPAGIAAAISAARNGARTLLVERYGYLGGMITGSYVTFFLGFGNGKKQIVKGLADEFIVRLDEAGGLPGRRNKCGDCDSDAEFVKWLSVIMLEEAGVEVLLHSLVAASVVEDNIVKGIIIENKSGRQAILSKVTIDATADGDAAHFAGADAQTDNYDITLCLDFKDIDKKRAKESQQKDAGTCVQPIEQFKAQDGIEPSGGGTFSNRSAVNVEDLTYVENEARKRAMNKVIFMRKNMPGYENVKLAWTAPQLGVRESRKVIGEYVVTEDDILQSQRFSDTIGLCGAHMHGYQLYDIHGLDYDIPYRCLIPEKVDNLLVSGRCISADHKAINTLRLIVPCMLTGEAAGTAAALAIQNAVVPRKIDIDKLQDNLRKQKVNLG